MNKKAVFDLLSIRRQELEKLPPQPWSDIESWVAKTTPLIRKFWPEHFEDFQKITTLSRISNPYVYVSSYIGDPVQQAKYDAQNARSTASYNHMVRSNAENTKKRVLVLIDGIIETALLDSEEEENMNTDKSLFEEKRRKRYTLLRKVYDEAKGSQHNPAPFFSIAEKEGLSREEAEDIYYYLFEERLIKDFAVGTSVVITHRGIVEVEESIRNPGKPTEHFTPSITQHFNAPVHGGVQVGGHKNTQNVNITSNSTVDEVVGKLVEVLKSSSLPDLEKEDAIEAAQRLPQLAEKEQSTEVLERAKSRLEIIKSTVETGKQLSEVAGPLLLWLFNHFS